MILKEGSNIPVASAQIENMTAALTLFRNYKSNQGYQMTHLITFLSTPSVAREEFYCLFTESIVVMNNRYAQRILQLLP